MHANQFKITFLCYNLNFGFASIKDFINYRAVEFKKCVCELKRKDLAQTLPFRSKVDVEVLSYPSQLQTKGMVSQTLLWKGLPPRQCEL